MAPLCDAGVPTDCGDYGVSRARVPSVSGEPAQRDRLRPAGAPGLPARVVSQCMASTHQRTCSDACYE